MFVPKNKLTTDRWTCGIIDLVPKCNFKGFDTYYSQARLNYLKRKVYYTT